MPQQVPPARDSGHGSGRNVGPQPGKAGTGADGDAGPGRAAAVTGRAPFAWQHGSRLFLLESGPLGWVLAELRFDPVGCCYVEVRRASYRWAREATGALLSRALAEGDAIAERTDRALRAWLTDR